MSAGVPSEDVGEREAAEGEGVGVDGPEEAASEARVRVVGCRERLELLVPYTARRGGSNAGREPEKKARA